MNFFRNFLITSSSTLTVTVLALLNNILITRQLGPDGRGIYAVVSNLVLLLMLIFGEGIRRSNTILIGKYKDKLSLLLQHTLICSMAVAIIFTVLFFLNSLYSFLLPNINAFLIIIGLSIALFSILWQSIQALFLGLKNIIKFNLMVIIQIIIVITINVIGVLLFNFQVEEFISALLVSAILTFLFGIVFLIPLVSKSSRLKKNIFKESSGIGIRSTISATSMFLTLRGNIFLINFFLNPFQAGIYAIATLFSEIMQKIPNIIGPLVISETVNNFSLKPAIYSARLVRTVFLFNLIVILILASFGKIIIIILFGIQFQESFLPLLYLLPALLFLGPGGIINAYYMGRAFPIPLLWINTMTGVLNILLNIIFIPKFGIIASASISSVTYLFWLSALLFYFRLETKIPMNEIIVFKKEDFVYLLRSIRKLRDK